MRLPHWGTYGGGGSYEKPSYKYWMYLVVSEYLEDFRPLDDLFRLLRKFGEQLGSTAMVSMPGEGSYAQTRASILRKSWDPKVLGELKAATIPYLLVLRTELATFSPDKDRFCLIWFDGSFSDSSEYIGILAELAEEVSKGTDLFEWAKKRAYRRFVGRVLAAIEFKPGFAGFSVDLKELGGTLKKRHWKWVS